MDVDAVAPTYSYSERENKNCTIVSALSAMSLAPLAFLSLYLANRDQTLSLTAQQGEAAAISLLAVTLPEAVAFAIIYFLAIYYRHRPALHMRYMCSTAFSVCQSVVG
jgi:hypothetical protein